MTAELTAILTVPVFMELNGPMVMEMLQNAAKNMRYKPAESLLKLTSPCIPVWEK